MRDAIVFSFICFQCSFIYAHTINGRVTDSNNIPLIDVLVYSPTTDIHSHTDEKGYFSIKGLENGDTLLFRYLGFNEYMHIVSSADLNKSELFIQLEEETFTLEQVYVSNSLKSISQVSQIDLQTNPVTSSQDVLRRVPGLIIGQHAGGGKAEQIFLRGFDIDHGTDISISVDGMPVNMVSHAHGQGYADLHFLIPETIENIDFGKGPYYANSGNFTTAGYVDFRTKERLDNSMIGFEFGEFNTRRLVGLLDVSGNSNERQSAYLALEFSETDGPFESPQNFNRFNGMFKYTTQIGQTDELSLLASRFQSKWDASGQIPMRLVDAGTISRFGAVDDTEGGSTDRTNISAQHTRELNRSTYLKTNAYYSNYNFELFSNFTFFLNNPETGDQIQQLEERNIFGLESKVISDIRMENYNLALSGGIGFRYDDVNNNQLSFTRNRKEIQNRLALGDVDETNWYTFVNADFDFDRWLINVGLRWDAFEFQYVDNLISAYQTQSQEKSILLPKLNVIYNPSTSLQLYAKTGRGFHSNDSRVVVAQGGEEILPAAWGVDLGTVWKPIPKLWINTGLWYLFLEQEFVYVGDEAVVEASGRTERQGVEMSVRAELLKNVFVDADINYTYARSIDEDEGNDYIPLAPDLTSVGGISYKAESGFNASLRYRYVKDRAANEDNSITAEGYFISDVNLGYGWKNIQFGLTIENLFDSDWNEAQFATESRLANEAESFEELHFTPGVPRYFRASVQYKF